MLNNEYCRFFYLEGITAPYIPTVEVGMKLALIGKEISFWPTDFVSQAADITLCWFLWSYDIISPACWSMSLGNTQASPCFSTLALGPAFLCLFCCFQCASIWPTTLFCHTSCICNDSVLFYHPSGCFKDHVVGEDLIADYLLFTLNKSRCFK